MDWVAMLSSLERYNAHNLLRAQAYAARELLGVEVPQTIAGGPAARLYCWRGVARWRQHGADIEPPLLRLFLSGLAYRWDPAARMMPFSVKLVRRLLYGSEPPPVGPPSGSASACASRPRRRVLAKPAASPLIRLRRNSVAHRLGWQRSRRCKTPRSTPSARSSASRGGVEAPTYSELYSGEWMHPTCSGRPS